MEFHVVGRAKDGMDSSALYSIDEVGAFDKAWAENWMAQIGCGLVEGADGITLRHAAMSKARQLRKHKPHPMRALVSCGQLLPHVIHDGGLRLDKSFQIKIRRHGS
jgi:hypothetical protein